jgi:Uma2 family endonuclease
MAIEVERQRRLFTIEEYEKMVETGILTKYDRVELIEGEIVEMSPIGEAHAECVSNLTHLLVRRFDDLARVWVQGPVRVPPRSRPQPDLALLRRGSYRHGGVAPTDAWLFIEVADTSLRYDRSVKQRIYARARVPEYWIVDTNAEVVEVYRSPRGDRYAERSQAARGESVAPLAFPDVAIPVDAIFA